MILTSKLIYCTEEHLLDLSAVADFGNEELLSLSEATCKYKKIFMSTLDAFMKDWISLLDCSRNNGRLGRY